MVTVTVTNKLDFFRVTATIVYCFKMLHLTLFTKEKRRALANPKLGSFIFRAKIGNANKILKGTRVGSFRRRDINLK